MKRGTLLISLIAIALIFWYWKKKRDGLFLSCATIWDDMDPAIQPAFFNTLVMIDNSPDVLDYVYSSLDYNEELYEYGKCKLSADYLFEGPLILSGAGYQGDVDLVGARISRKEYEQIMYCQCNKHRGYDLSQSMYWRTSTKVS